jgi:hypothetical protein
MLEQANTKHDAPEPGSPKQIAQFSTTVFFQMKPLSHGIEINRNIMWPANSVGRHTTVTPPGFRAR